MKKTILTCAVTGNLVTRDQNPNLPVTPEEIATSAIEAAHAGAAVVHIHVRDPLSGKPSMRVDLYEEVVNRIGDSGVDVIINLTTGEGGRFVPSLEDPRVHGEGTTLVAPEKRVQHVVELAPEMCSLDFNTMYSGTAVVINTPRNVGVMAKLIQGAGTKPELEVFDSSDIRMALHLIESGLIAGPHFFQIVLGVNFGAPATPEAVHYLRNLLPAGCEWSAFGIGRHAFPMMAASFLAGGHVRIGMEDTVRISRDALCTGNAQLVEAGVRLIRSLGGELATPQEARLILGITKRASS